MNKLKTLSKTEFRAIVGSGVGLLMLVFAAYSVYEGPERYLANQILEQEKHKQFQYEIESEIASEQRSLLLAQHIDANNLNEATLFDNSSSKSTQPLKEGIAPVAKSKKGNSNFTDVDFASREEVLMPEAKESAIYPETANQGLANSGEGNKTTLSKLAFMQPKKLGFTSSLGSNQISRLLTNPNEFEPKKKCLISNGYVGISGGGNQYAVTPDFSPIVSEQISSLYTNIENTERVGMFYNKSLHFNVAAFGGFEVAKGLEIEGGFIYNRSIQEFTSIYKSLERRDFSYVEWVSTGESGGPDGQPIYQPVERVEHFYTTNTDTVVSEAVNQSIELPLIVRYNYNLGKFAISASVGSSAILFNHAKIETTNLSNNETLVTNKDQQGLVQVNALMGLGLSYQLAPSLNLRFEPLFKPSLYGNNKTTPDFNSNSTSFNLGLKYSL